MTISFTKNIKMMTAIAPGTKEKSIEYSLIVV